MSISKILSLGPVMPVIVIEQANHAIPLGEALLTGGIKTIEITLRTSAALNAIEQLAKHLPEIYVGAGTILTKENATQAKNSGAKFCVSPGTTSSIIDACNECNISLLPGASTVSEMLTLSEAGFSEIKFFPASAAGGIQFIKSLASPLPKLKFCPTGGISYETASEWLSLVNVSCVGGSWIAPAKDINDQNFSEITARAKQATKLVN
ncbi:MAG: 2-dehydro-3-deoxy-phosphogluconate aldolase [Alphaproteobacteria bacterium]|nr:MAG: 2-dehydro-3-deoxy-phosphogluconate aldolase [Alphaproteobacteria bacterium]